MTFKARVFTPDYLLGGEMKVSEALIGELNNPNRRTVSLHQAQVTTLDPQATLPALTLAAVVLPKRTIVGIDLSDPPARSAVRLPPRLELVVLYTSRFIIQAQLCLQGDMPVGHVFNVLGGDFFPVTRAHIHPIRPTRPFEPVQAALLMLNKGWIDFYHQR
ncbi:MAG: hypothetical protein ACE5H9_15465 [Anaerolineae bacterium]